MESTGGMTFGYLPQDGLQLHGRSVFDECLSAFAKTQALEHKIQRLHSQLAELPPHSGEYAAVIEQLTRSDAEFHAQDGYTIEARVGTVLLAAQDGGVFRRLADANCPRQAATGKT